MKKLILALMAIAQLSKGQEANTIKFLGQLPESQWYNASNSPSNNLSIGLPVLSSTYFGLYNTGFTFHDLVQHNANGDALIDVGNVIGKLKTHNYIGMDASFALFSISGRIKKIDSNFVLGFSINDRVNMQFGYPKDFFALLWYGNGAYIGKTMNIGGFSMNASYYREYALHATESYGKWTFGISPKLLFGKMNINTKRSSVNLYTDTGAYGLTANADMLVQTSGVPDSADNSRGFLNSGSKVSNYIYNKANKGFAIDLGANYKLNEMFDFTVGLNSLGFINWNSMVHNYTANHQLSFDGLDLGSYLQGDSTAISTTKWSDTVKKILKFDETSGSYRTTLTYEVFGIANITYGRHHFSAMLDAQRFNASFIYSGTLWYQIKFGHHFTGGLSYTAKTGSAANIGGSIVLQFLHMQWYFITDNWYAALKPLDTKYANLHLGMNLVFGTHDKRKKKVEAVLGDAPKE